ncbi:hypothetical protein LCGC14_0360170 [marine sediment metagenome]|uniref:Uncharacterized protein n=1 Tax=marine sediment metagenome TaxID=412755 RepID=A0A0F9WGH7_9ZZZZ
MSNLSETQITLQEIYDKHFSFLEFNKFLCEYGQLILTAYCIVSADVSFDPREISRLGKGESKLKLLMKARLIDTLICIQNKISEDIKRIEEIK